MKHKCTICGLDVVIHDEEMFDRCRKKVLKNAVEVI